MPEEADGFLSIADTGAAAARESLLAGGYALLALCGHELVIAVAGLGKVNAAMTAASLIERHNCSALVSAGTAGGLSDGAKSKVIIGSEIIQHDYGRSRGHGELELYRPGVPPLPSFPNDDIAFRLAAEQVRDLQQQLREREDVIFGCFASGDVFVNDAASRQRLIDLGAVAVDMECAAVAQVAERYGLPWLVAKGISDEASDESHDDFLAGLVAASNHSAEIVAALLPVLG